MDQDIRLVRAVRRSGPEAFRKIVEHYQSAVFALAMSRVRDFHRAEDVAQQTFLEAYQRLGSLKDPSKLGGWLKTITVRLSVDALRRKRDEVEIRSDDHLLVGDAVADIERRETERQVRAAINRLKKHHRDTTALFYVDGYSIAEVAAILEVPVGTVKRRLHTAREILKTEMVDLVKDTLKNERPGEGFGEQVLALISRYGVGDISSFRELRDAVGPIAIEGREGLEKALDSPHPRLRKASLLLISDARESVDDDDVREQLIELHKMCLRDPNKKVRTVAMHRLWRLGISEERQRKEIAPIVIEMLDDRAGLIVIIAAGYLGRFPEEVPLEKAALALANATDRTRPALTRLVRKIVGSKG